MNPEYMQIPLGRLTVDERYQRELSPARVKKLAARFDRRLLGALECSRRVDGTIAVFDGQHRLELLKLKGEPSAPCLVHQMTDREEAELFVALQRNRKALLPIERFRARVFSGDPAAKEIVGVANDAGFSIATRKGAGGIRAVTALENVYRREGAAGLKATLDMIARTWDGDAKSTDGYFLEGVAQFISDYSNRIGPLEEAKLSEHLPVVYLRRALPNGGGGAARFGVESELRKVAGIRGRKLTRKAHLAVLAVAA
jgi:hypothetical protein